MKHLQHIHVLAIQIMKQTLHQSVFAAFPAMFFLPGCPLPSLHALLRCFSCPAARFLVCPPASLLFAAFLVRLSYSTLALALGNL